MLVTEMEGVTGVGVVVGVSEIVGVADGGICTCKRHKIKGGRLNAAI